MGSTEEDLTRVLQRSGTGGNTTGSADHHHHCQQQELQCAETDPCSPCPPTTRLLPEALIQPLVSLQMIIRPRATRALVVHELIQNHPCLDAHARSVRLPALHIYSTAPCTCIHAPHSWTPPQSLPPSSVYVCVFLKP